MGASETATAVYQTSSHTYNANFRQDWCIGSVPHGGYVTATLLRVVKKHFETTLAKQDQPHTIALHLDFLRRTQTGPATFNVKDVKLGRQTSIVHVALSQGDREEVVGYVTQSNLQKETGLSFITNFQAHPQRVPLSSTLAALESGADPLWTEKKAWPNETFRQATKQIRAWFPRDGQPAQNIYDEWMCFRDPSEKWTNENLGFIVDMFPQICESFYFNGFDQYNPKLEEYFSKEELQRLTKGKAPFWYPTLLLNLEVKKDLGEGVKFLFSRLQTKSIKNGRYDLEVLICDEGGELVALSHHVCFAVSAERNLAARRGNL
ncbi:Thioesterase-like protein TwmA [Fulvia fulva]|nr:Thioesterase-like protein TwmA [Fulvia fulva]WPV19017.1 Thioesterase-like protein TwmA [Fulvia fulva]WPV33889.1 Thioesterase-like protein TwmA [Fulvia fulva]